MYFEVFLKIFVGIFAVFGFFCLVKLVGVTWFGYDNVRVTIDIDSPDTVENINSYLNEAENLCLVCGGGEVVVLVRNEYSDEKLLKKLERRNIKYYII